MSQIRTILEDLYKQGMYVAKHEDDPDPDGGKVIFVHHLHLDQAESQIKAWIEENVIGSDDKITLVKNKNNVKYIKASDMPKYYRNVLRQSQRQQLREEK